jgi:P-type conjugative transfer protein TrbJ
MTRLRKLLSISTVVAGVLIVGRADRAEAIPVVCVNCSTEWDQLLSYAKQVQQVATQLQSYVLQGQQYLNQLENTIALPMQVYGTVQGDMVQVQNLSNIGSIFSGNAGSILNRLNALNGLSSYGYVLNMPSTIGNQFSLWRQTIGNNLDATGKVLQLQQSQEATDAAALNTIQSHSQGAVGQVQAIQAGNELAGANGKVLHEIQQTMLTETQMQANQMAVDADRKATEDVAMQQFLTTTPQQTSGGMRF